MQANSAEQQPLESSSSILGITPGFMDGSHLTVEESIHHAAEPTYFHGYYTSCMEMYADSKTVANYLDSHHEWFKRCAHPMTATPLGENGYELTVGKFGSFGYEIEPKIGLDLLPQDQGVYRIQTISIPDYESAGYDVDFQAAMYLVETENHSSSHSTQSGSEFDLPAKMTRVEWELNLKVAVLFPRFIHALPKPLIQSTGDRLLNQIVRQVSRRLTRKVQDDFHSIHGLSSPKKRKRYPWSRESDACHLED
ncbi:MAG TPA: DUF1997 domain-containing protein [Crinalium sp.]|jgi:hypothetical protein